MEIAMESDSVLLTYRPNVALILENTEGQILIGERRDVAEAWQFPQGGVEDGESFEQALYREVKEEILLTPESYRILESKGPYRYQFPKGFEKYRALGQEQHYFRALLLGEKSLLKMEDTSCEFRALRWIAPNAFRISWLPLMKQPVYQKVFQDFFQLTLMSSSETSLK
ncbi:MAG: NUDIX domain-containing protein [Verrucomicrobia bacterium]|nr:MAG: NUDIX domain-containing protein [Verrucomicrobiota bacterium]